MRVRSIRCVQTKTETFGTRERRAVPSEDFSVHLRPSSKGPQRLHRGGESGAGSPDDPDDRNLQWAHPNGIGARRVRAGVRGARSAFIEVGLICTNSMGIVLPTGFEPVDRKSVVKGKRGGL